jgi:hypothetical protein
MFSIRNRIEGWFSTACRRHSHYSQHSPPRAAVPRPGSRGVNPARSKSAMAWSAAAHADPVHVLFAAYTGMTLTS